jgi:hypothetical protein
MSVGNSLRQGPGNLPVGIRYAAVGIPQGLIVDPEGKEATGAVRRGGEVVPLEPAEYGIWTTLLTPLTLDAAARVAAACHWGDPEPVINLLEGLNLLVSIDLDKPMHGALSRLRPIPLGCALGNAGGDPARFEIQDATLSRSAPVSLDLVSAMFWWEFDGAASLHEVVSAITSRVPGLPPRQASVIAAQLAYELMRDRMLYLDTPRARER